jgi:hypothetical protein
MSGDELAGLLAPRAGKLLLGPNQRPYPLIKVLRKLLDWLDDVLNGNSKL